MDVDDAAPVVIKRRPKAGARSSGASLSRSLTADNLAADGEDDDGPTSAVVQRPKKGKLATAPAKKPSKLSFGVDDEAGPGTDAAAAPKRALKRADFTAAPSYASTPAPLRLPESATADKPSLYSAAHLSELRASTQSRPRAAAADEGPEDATPMQVDDDDADARLAASAIPTANAIAAARMKRETLRKLGPEHEAVEGDGAGSGDGFISLDLASRPSKKGESRLVREEDETGEGEDDMAEYTGAQERIPLGHKATEQRKRQTRAGMVDLINDAADEDEDDDEIREWEAAQARRGDAQQARPERTASGRAPYRAAPIPQQAPVPSLPAVQARLNAALAELQVSHSAGAETLEGVARQRAELDEQEGQLRSEVERADAHFAWFDDLNAWLADVVAFLDAKYPALERIERDNLSHQSERLLHVMRKRYADDADDLAAFTGMPVPSRLPPLDPAPALANGGDATADEVVDAPRSSVRQARRQARSAASDGFVTDDDALDGDVASDLSAAVGLLIDAASSLFADVQSDAFRDPDVGVRPRFAEWRARFPDSYAQSFAGLALVGVWEFWARAEMALWNPFGVPELPPSPVSLDAYQWHASLSSYAHHEHADPSSHANAENDDVVAGLVGTVVVPRLEPYARAAYDPYSSKATGRALAMVEEVTYCLDRDGRKFEGLVLAFMAPIQLAVRRAQDMVTPVLRNVAEPAAALDPAALAARDRFASRQLKLAVQALRWRRYVRDTPLAGTGTALEPFIARELVGRVLLPVLEAGARATIASQVLALFPPGSALPVELADRLRAVASAG